MSDQLPLPLVLAPYARFETYLAGPNAAVVGDLRREGRKGRLDAVWIWGAESSGKSHLLQAACTALPRSRVMYLPLAGPGRGDVRVLDGLDTLDLLALDDVDLVAGDDEWNRALFGLFNGLEEQGGRLLLSASQPPASTPFALADLASRATAATVYQLLPLTEFDRVQALKLHASARGVELSDVAARYLLARVRRDMGALVGWLDVLDRASLAAQRKITIPLIRETLGGHSVTI
ncbi:MAG TPA: DnaA regulatory inactivator Hda [Gammaproteobacteria bacterium]|nr:DnaA regulatory inactivator Hda [Gammaproteobacteria bacterium]